MCRVGRGGGMGGSHEKFCEKKYAASTAPCEIKIYRLVGKFRTTGSVMGKKKVWETYVKKYFRKARGLLGS
jgi:hypothetical protein